VFCKGLAAFAFGWTILRFEFRLFGYQAQPSGLRPHPAFSDFEFSHSLVNTTRWLTAEAAWARPGNWLTRLTAMPIGPRPFAGRRARWVIQGSCAASEIGDHGPNRGSVRPQDFKAYSCKRDSKIWIDGQRSETFDCIFFVASFPTKSSRTIASAAGGAATFVSQLGRVQMLQMRKIAGHRRRRSRMVGLRLLRAPQGPRSRSSVAGLQVSRVRRGTGGRRSGCKLCFSKHELVKELAAGAANAVRLGMRLLVHCPRDGAHFTRCPNRPVEIPRANPLDRQRRNRKAKPGRSPGRRMLAGCAAERDSTQIACARISRTARGDLGLDVRRRLWARLAVPVTIELP
jgi:hypothetical protein